jgi:hypothetical protein
MQVSAEGKRTGPGRAERGGDRVDLLARVLFVAAIVGLGFGYGYVARSWKLFPYAQMQQAGDAVPAAVKYYADADYLEVPTDRRRAGVTVLDESRAAPGLTFLGLYTGEGFSARLVDLRGSVVHEWRVGFREVWGERPPHVQMAADDSIIEWHRL